MSHDTRSHPFATTYQFVSPIKGTGQYLFWEAAITRTVGLFALKVHRRTELEHHDSRFSKMAREKGRNGNGIPFGYHPGHPPDGGADEGGEVEKKTVNPQSRQKQLTEATELKRLD
ncbi:hypothetical protein KM043_011110 [Ampulex compressa]|nr:hypothetical protein KM043_011110 [Ampulex compressa]